MEIAAIIIVIEIAIIIVTAMIIMKLTAQRKLEELTGLDIELAVMILGAIVVLMMMTMIVAAINRNKGGYPVDSGTRLFNNYTDFLKYRYNTCIKLSYVNVNSLKTTVTVDCFENNRLAIF